MPAIKGDMYINTHCNYSQPASIKLDNENIGGHLTPLHPEPHVTLHLQGAVTWRNQCYDRVIMQDVRIPSAVLKVVFSHILFFSKCNLGFDERRLSYRFRYTCFILRQ